MNQANQLAPLDQRPPRVLCQPWIDGGRRVDIVVAPGSTVAEIVGVALPAATENVLPLVRVTIGNDFVPRALWARVRPKESAVVVIRVAPGNSGTLRAALSVAVGVAALALGQVWAAPLAASAGFGGSALATGVAQGLIGGTVLLAGTFLINSLVPLRRDQSQGAGQNASPTYQITGFRNVANPDGIVPCVMGKVRFAPPYAALPYTEAVGGETYIRALFLVGYGPVKIRDLRLGDTPIEKFKEVDVEIREGRATDTRQTLYPAQVMEERLTVDLNQAYAATFGAHTRFTASDAKDASIDITFPNGLFWMHSVKIGNNVTTYPLPMTVAIRIRMRKDGAGPWVHVIDWPISAFSQKSVTFAYKWTLPERGRYEIEVTRLTGDLDDLNSYQQFDQFVSTSVWTALRSFRPEYPVNFTHPVALVAIRARASKQLNGVIDNLNLEASRECLDWNGSAWVTAETQNPASLLRYAMQGPALAWPLADADIDLDSLAEFHEYCAAKGLNYNRVHDYEGSAYDAWADIAAAGRAAPRDDGEAWGVVIDRAQPLVMQHMTARNSWSFSGSRDYIRFPDAFRVQFTDETNSHKQAERVIPWPGFAGAPQIMESLTFPGVTDPSQIWKEARRRQYELINRRDTFFVMQDFEGVLARRGDRVSLNHDVITRAHKSARVRTVSGNVVGIDDQVEMDASKSYAIRFRKLAASDSAPDVYVIRNVRTVAGAHDAVVMIGAGDAPQSGDLIMFGEAGSETIDCIVREVEGAENGARRFTLVEHAPQIEALADAETPPPWNGRVGELSDVFAPSLDFGEEKNTQHLLIGWP